jgi:hypothetical protein
MAIRGADGSISIAGTTIPNGSEAVLVTLGPIEVPADSLRAVVIACVQFSTAAGVTSVLLRLRRGLTTADALVQQGGTIPQTASSNGGLTLFSIDPLLLAATVSYCITGQAAGGTGSNLEAVLSVLFL